MKALSKNQLCAAIITSAGTSKLKIYNFASSSDSTLSTTPFGTLADASYTGDITLDATKVDVSDDCTGLRIGDKIFHWDGSSVYVADTLPTGVTTLGNPVFS